MNIEGKTILITGGARRVGKAITLGLARAGANVVIHFGHSKDRAERLRTEIQVMGAQAHLYQADFNSPAEIEGLIEFINANFNLYALINNAGIYSDLSFHDTTLSEWNRHMMINLTAPFLLSQGIEFETSGRIVNILDWRAFRPAAAHFPYMISKAGLLGLTRSMAAALAPDVVVNGIAFGAILPASDGTTSDDILEQVPQGRWANPDEVVETVRFLLEGPTYITGEIIHLDGGRHLI